MYDDGIVPGRVVVSKSGRDKGRRCIIVKVLDNDFIQIADGDLRRIEKPKKKKLKHVKIENMVADELAVRLRRGERISNADIRKFINNF